MVQVTDAIFSGGVLRPERKLDLKDQQRVRLIVQPISAPSAAERAEAERELREGIAAMGFKSNGSYPSRDELHERR